MQHRDDVSREEESRVVVVEMRLKLGSLAEIDCDRGRLARRDITPAPHTLLSLDGRKCVEIWR